MTEQSNLRVCSLDGTEIFVHRWLTRSHPKAIVQIAHGLAEHGGRYARLADALNSLGYAVYANDHRGHGRTARSQDELGFFAQRGGWRACVEDLWQVNRCIAAEQPGLPVVLLGHSMGSTMALQFISNHGDALAGVVLSGASGKPTRLATAGRLIARLERLRLGARGKSALLHSLTFAKFNKWFNPARTEFDWLSSDSAEVERYIADPLCGFQASVQLWIDLLDGWARASSPSNWQAVPKSLPIYVISGKHDPVSAGCRQLTPMLEAFHAAGLGNLEHKFYPRARHELLNEINRQEVTRDLIIWLDRIFKI